MEPINSNSIPQTLNINSNNIKTSNSSESNNFSISSKQSASFKVKDEGVINHVQTPENASMTSTPSISMLQRTQNGMAAMDISLAMKSDMEKSSSDISDSFSALKESNPDIAAKDWGVSVGENNELVIIENEDTLSDDERQIIMDELKSSSVLTQSLIKLTDDLNSQLDYDRNGEVKMSNSIGKYDLSRSNFTEIIDYREAFESSSDKQPNSQQVMDSLYSQIMNKAEDSFSVENRTTLVYQP